MTVRDGLFAHWPVDPDELRPHVPEPLTLETYDGRAWLSVVPFVLANVGVRGTPPLTRTAFPELNVRTYVRYRGDPGLFFFSIDLGSPLLAALVGRTTRLPVYYARMHASSDEETVSFSSVRRRRYERARSERLDDEGAARFVATYRPDPDASPSPAEPDSLAYWLVERRRFYAPEAEGVLAAEIAHDPWPLQPAELTIRENTLFEAAGLPSPVGEPVVHYCAELPMTGSVPRRLSD